MSGPYHTVSYSMPMAVPSKGNQYPTYSQYSVSPPECDDSISSVSGGPSYGYSGTSTGYIGGSSHEYESAGSASGVDFQEYMQDRFSTSFNPIPLDRSMAVQAQTLVPPTKGLKADGILAPCLFYECKAPLRAQANIMK